MAGVLEPYLGPDGAPTSNRGMSFVDPEVLKASVTRLDAEGFQVHIHAIGERAVREALDAFQAARDANGANDHRHHIAHIQVVHPDDIPRSRRSLRTTSPGSAGAGWWRTPSLCGRRSRGRWWTSRSPSSARSEARGSTPSPPWSGRGPGSLSGAA